MEEFGRYRVLEEVGHGGFGRVYKGFDPTVGRTVAIKVLTAGHEEGLLTRFRHEAAAAGRLRHRNIITVHDFGDHNGTPYLVMEYLEGQDLQRALRAGRKFSVLEKVSIMSQVAEALRHAHMNGIVHRDVKPANIMLLDDGAVKIMDFGIARLLTSRSTRLTEQGGLIGTVGYMAPEQFQGCDVDELCDIFAYGVIYYELLTGRHPFHADDARTMMYRITAVDPAPIDILRSECPAGLDEIVMRALQKPRELRYQSFEDLQLDTAPIRLRLERQMAALLVADAGESLSAGDPQRAHEIVRKALELDPDSEAAQKLREAIRRQTQATSTRQRSAAAVRTARSEMESRQYEAAIDGLESALRLDPTNPEIARVLARAREDSHRSERAGALLEQARRDVTGDNFSGAYRNVLECLHNDPDRRDAAELFVSVRKGMERRERERALGEGLARALDLIHWKVFGEALSVLRNLDASFPGSGRVRQLIASTESALQESGEAPAQRVECDSDTPAEAVRAVLIEADALLRKCEFDASIALLRENSGRFSDRQIATELAQAEAAKAEFLRARAEGLWKRQRWSEALAVIDSARGGNQHDDALQRLRQSIEDDRVHTLRENALADAHALSASGDYDAAIEKLRAAGEEIPNDDAIRTALSQTRKERESALRRKAEQVAKEAAAFLEAGAATSAISAVDRGFASSPGIREMPELAGQLQTLREKARKRLEAQALCREASALLEAGRHAEALLKLERGSELHSDPDLRQLLEQVRESEPVRSADAIDSIAQETTAMLARGEWENAINTLEIAIGRYGKTGRLTDVLDEAHKQRTSIQPPAPTPVTPAPLPETGGRRALRKYVAAAAVASAAAAGLWYAASRSEAARYAQLEIATAPAGALVQIGTQSCREPVCRFRLEHGLYDVTAELPGYQRERTQVTVGREGAARVLTLRPLPAVVRVAADLEGAAVRLDGNPAGRIHAGELVFRGVPPGVHTLTVTGPAGQNVALGFEVQPGTRPKLIGQVEHRGATALAVSALGSEAEFFTDRGASGVWVSNQPVPEASDGRRVARGLPSGAVEVRAGPNGPVFALTTAAEPTLNLFIQAGRNTGTLLVDTKMDGVTVLLDGRRYARTTQNGLLRVPLPAKRYAVAVEKQGYTADAPREVEVAANAVQQVTFRLVPQKGTLLISGAAAGTAVVIDGRPAGTVSGSGKFAIETGEHSITLSKDGFLPRQIPVRVQPGQTVELGGAQATLAQIPERKAAEPGRPEPPPDSREWQSVQAAQDPDAVDAFRRKYPASRHADEAARLADRLDWERTRSSRDERVLQAFLTRRPASTYAPEARKRIEQIEWESVDQKDLPSVRAYVREHGGNAAPPEAQRTLAALEQREQAREEEQAIRRTVERFRAAFEAKDIATLRSLWPTMPASVARGMREIRSMSLTMEPVTVERSGDRAAVVCRRTLKQHFDAGPTRDWVGTATLQLRLNDGVWSVESVEYSSAR